MTYTIDFGEGMTLSLAPSTKAEEIIQQIYTLVSTVRGTVPCYRDYGVDSTYLHRPINVAKTLYASAIVSAIKQYVPDVTVDRVTFSDDAEHSSTLIPILEVSFNE